MAENLDVQEKVALVIGGTGGFGQPITELLRQHGTTVVTVSRHQSSDAHHIAADVRSPGEATRVIDEVMQQHKRIDIVINAVGVVAFGDVVSTSVDTLEELFLTNTFAHIFICTAALPHMTKGGVIVGISGVVAEQNLPGMAIYGASKAAVRSFNEGFAREARRVGVRVVDARPPHSETGLASRAIAGTAPRFPQGLEPTVVAARIVEAIVRGETDLPASAFTQ